MRRKILACAGVLLSVVALGSDSPKEYGDVMVADPLEGTWRLIGYELGSQKLDLPIQCATTYRNGTYMECDSDGKMSRGNYRIDPTRKPAHLDYFPSSGQLKGQTVKWIFQVNGDTLRFAGITYKVTEQHPQSFSDDGIIVWTFKRVR